jgi:amidase
VTADLAFAGAAQQAELVRGREVKPRELVEMYLERIERLDKELNAFRVTFDERALAEADQAEARVAAGDERPLLGVPVAIKDNVDVAGEVTTHGTAAHWGPAPDDAEIVKRLRAAGAIVIGKTLLPELAIHPFTESQTFGATRNPWSLDRSAGGSSGGSAAAVAAGMVGIAEASDGGGSIRIPAACTGLFGLKPQRGRISLMPDPQHWYGLSVAGCVSRTVRDTALFMDVVSGGAEGDAHAAVDPVMPFVQATEHRPARLRIAWSTKPIQPGPVDEQVRAAVESMAELLRGLGHDVREQDPAWGLQLPAFLPRYLRGIRDDAARLPHTERLEARTRSLVRMGRMVSDRRLRKALAAERKHAQRLGQTFEIYDVLMTPTLSRPAERVGKWEGKGALLTLNGEARYVPFTTPWNLTGQPAAAVPAGFTPGGLPLSVQLIGRPHDEVTLLGLAAEIEAERPWAKARPPVS